MPGLRQGDARIPRFSFRRPFYTKRFSYYIGRRYRPSSIQDIARELHLDWHTVRELVKQYMREHLRRADGNLQIDACRPHGQFPVLMHVNAEVLPGKTRCFTRGDQCDRLGVMWSTEALSAGRQETYGGKPLEASQDANHRPSQYDTRFH